MTIPSYSISSLTDRGVRALNEDTLLTDEARGLFGVFDGASSLVPYESPSGKTGARIASEVARETFLTEPNNDLLATAIFANKQIDAQHRKCGIDTTLHAARFACAAAVAKITDTTTHLLQIGDCIIIVEHRDGRVIVPLGYYDQDLEVMKKWRQLANQGVTNLRSVLNGEILALRNSANQDYGMLNGDRAAEKMIITTSISTSDIRSLLIITDGLFIPKSNPEDIDSWETYIQICRNQGIRGLLDIVRSKENEDPELVQYPRYKKHDDATGVFVIFDRFPSGR